jgi:hypothetical protein
MLLWDIERLGRLQEVFPDVYIHLIALWGLLRLVGKVSKSVAGPQGHGHGTARRYDC